ncbi:hypothetical protein G8759_25000 [Spirosoma aureum]|uniref:Dystroglycan-type cadherin-like domain-containing protein n=1 Tax=Spirosoma aureum TaxID=2692134 RepID=A0A6G9ATK5_9BACT|nr:hypothetical protein [Spirosoma aureum]QIP15656.1 hypothetical protein G8759_25000 [Spirosoma aureum]
MRNSTGCNNLSRSQNVERTSLVRNRNFIAVIIAIVLTSFGLLDSQAQPCSLTLTATNIKQPTCGGKDGSFNINVEGITAPYQYTLVKTVGGSPVVQENGTLIAGTPTFVFLGEGSYQVLIAKGGTCTGNVSVELTAVPLTLTATNIKQPTCGGKDGSFNINVEGITAPYQYTLVKTVGGSPVVQENGTLIAGTPTFVFLGEGSYQVLIAKGGTCTGNVSVELTAVPLTLTATNIKQPTCGGKDGSFNINVEGITAPYQYTLVKTVGGSPVVQENGTLIAGTPTFVFLGEGSYQVLIAKGGTCTGNVSVELTAVPLTLTATNIKQPTCGGKDGSFNINVEGITAPYQYTLVKTVGGSPVVQENGTLIAGTPTFVFLGEGSYQVLIAKGGTCTGSVSVTLGGLTIQASALSTNQPISVTASGCTGTINWNPVGGTGSANGNIYTFSAPGNYTLSASCTVGGCTSPSLTLQILPLDFAITGATMVNCQVVDETLSKRYQVSFTPQYTGQNANPISFSVVNEFSPTTNPGPYSLMLYGDNSTITLVANQSGNPETRYRFEWLAACGTGTSPNRPPTTSGIPSQTILQGQAYALNLATYFSDPDSQPLTYLGTGLPDGLSINGTLLSGTPSTTGVSLVSITALDPGGLMLQTSFNLTVSPMPTVPSTFTIIGATMVNCQVVDPSLSKRYEISFMPQYAGLDNTPVSFSIVNEFSPTTNPGPYTIQLYGDNPAITLIAKQSNVVASYNYNWLAACNLGSTRVGTQETGSGLAVKLLGNPVAGNSAEVEIGGVAGQRVQLNLVDLQGRGLHQQVITEASVLERVSVPLGTSRGQLFLQVSSGTQRKTLKVIKAD